MPSAPGTRAGGASVPVVRAMLPWPRSKPPTMRLTWPLDTTDLAAAYLGGKRLLDLAVGRTASPS